MAFSQAGIDSSYWIGSAFMLFLPSEATQHGRSVQATSQRYARLAAVIEPIADLLLPRQAIRIWVFVPSCARRYEVEAITCAGSWPMSQTARHSSSNGTDRGAGRSATRGYEALTMSRDGLVAALLGRRQVST